MSDSPRHGGSERASLQQRLPFANAPDIEEALIDDPGLSTGSLRNPSSGTKLSRALSGSSSGINLSSSFSQRTPTRSYYHHASHGSLEPLQYSSVGVREQTQELASWALGEAASSRPREISTSESDSDSQARRSSFISDREGGNSLDSQRPDVIEEVSEPVSPEDLSVGGGSVSKGNSSALTDLIRGRRQPPPRDYLSVRSKSSLRPDSPRGRGPPSIEVDDADSDVISETSALLPRERLSGGTRYKSDDYADRQWMPQKTPWSRFKYAARVGMHDVRHPETWDFSSMMQTSIGAVSAVLLGLLLNVLDALSYGMILFPLGESIFEKTGPDGISMFYVSCIVSQLTYSLGGSAFKGGVGSEMIEVVPFFHKMAYMILDRLGDDNPQAVLATVITAYALSSVLTGIIFLLLGMLRLGDLVSFFPRSILLGCIGGVGVFLVLTGLEVSAGLDSSMEWDLKIIERLLYPTTLVLWVLPLLLAVTLMAVRHYLKHPIVLPAFFVAVITIFYIVFIALPKVSLQDLQNHGWVFHAPDAGVPFWNFYTYYDFRKVDWDAIAETVPTMFALSFFGIIHVPINVPALGIAVQEDDVNINRELFGHGLSNLISGCVGSIQNYLVFANSRLFIQNGGNSRWAGVLLALGTAGIWIAGPAMIGYIPIMIVGTLIFMLGIEMVQEALWDTFGKLQRLEYLMVLAITIVMGFYDFVVGIVLGIVLACLNFVVQTSRISAIRATYSGTIAESTVRRHPVHRRFLHEVGSQIKVTKLAGYLFFGTIVAVEKKIRDLIEEEAFTKQPIRYLILDFSHVSGLDFSAAEAFVRMNRILRGRQVEMVLSGVSMKGEIGTSLIMVGLLEEDEDEMEFPPKVFENLNQALEACENELLLTFKQRSEQLALPRNTTNLAAENSVAIPRTFPPPNIGAETMYSSPRRTQVHQAATSTLKEHELSLPAKWNNFAQPLPLLLQAFKDLTDKDFDFWHRAVPYFQRREYVAGTVVYSRGDLPDGFYLLEEGILRAEYDFEQGAYYESIVAGTTCGELPFFAETDRTSTVVAEKDCVAWLLTKDKWRALEETLPDLATELLKVGLKLTSERMNSITSYVLVAAS